MVAVAAQRGNEAYGGVATGGDAFAIAVVFETVNIAIVAIEIENDRGLGYALRADDVKIDRVDNAPLHLPQFAREMIRFHHPAGRWRLRLEVERGWVGGQRQLRPVFVWGKRLRIRWRARLTRRSIGKSQSGLRGWLSCSRQLH